MQALDLATRNFAVAEHLLHLEQLFADIVQHQPSPDYIVSLCAEMQTLERTTGYHLVTVRHYWKEVSEHIGLDVKTIRGQLSDLIQRRNDIAHRADRPKDGVRDEECDPHGLRPITHAWVNTRITTAKSFVQAAAKSVESAVQQLEQIISQKEEQKLSRETLKRPSSDL